ncbi:MAG: hypothetical protein LBG94_03455, partial [Treponema sp.]|nr:hypothetical protein [Treponema sp.]
MAKDKNPSIYSDRSSIGSADELDEYGVWVKSEPQVLTGKSSDFDDFALPVEESAENDDSLSFDDAVLDLNDTSDITTPVAAPENIEFPDDDVSIDIDDDPLNNPSEIEDFNIPEDDDVVGITTGTEDFDLGQSNESTTEDESIDIEDTSFDEFEVPGGDGSSETSEVSIDDDALVNEDISIDDDILVNEEVSVDDDALTNEEISIGNDVLVKGETSIDDNFAGEDFSDAENFDLPTVKSIENNIDSLQDDFNAEKTGDGNLSTSLLMKIASELSSIRNELTDLKKEFANARSGAPVAAVEDDDEKISLTGDEMDNILGDEGEKTSDDAPSGEEASSGFDIGGDDEDEAIALTGDELDNILNSADFTEESGTEENPESEFSIDDLSEEDTSLDLSDDLSADGLLADDSSDEELSIDDLTIDTDDTD